MPFFVGTGATADGGLEMKSDRVGILPEHQIQDLLLLVICICKLLVQVPQ